MKQKANYLGFLALLSLIAILGLLTDNKGWFGFLGFLYYIRYFWVIADEGFIMYVKNAATKAFFVQLISLLPLLLVLGLKNYYNYIETSFGISFAIGIFVFTISITYSEYKELQGLSND